MNNPSDTGWEDRGERDRHLRSAQAIAGLCSWRTVLEENETVWTTGVADVFGIPPERAPDDQEALLEFVDPRDEGAVARKRNAIFEGEPFDIEYRIVVEGETRWVKERAELESDDGRPTVATGVIQEITEYKERERDLELFRTLVDHSTDGFYVIDRETGEILDVNETACRMLGYEREELLSRSVSEIDPEFSRERWEAFIETVREEGSATIESTHRRKDGSTFPVEVQASYVSLDRTYHVATVRDITERKARERELEAARKRYQTLIESAPDPIFVADADTGEILEANAAAAELREQPREEIVGLHQTELHPREDADRYRELFERHVENNSRLSRFEDGSQMYLSTADGDRIPVSISTATVSIGDQRVVHGIFRDISRRHHYQNSLKGVNEAAQELLHARTDAETATIAVDVATELLDVTGVGIYLYDEEACELVPAAYSDDLDELLDDHPRFSPGEGIAWRVFAEGEPARFDDVRTTDDVYNAGTPIRSELLVPLGEHGVFIVGDTSVDAFGELTVEIAETLAATAEAALDRAEQSQKLREKQRESTVQTRRLERVHRLNEEIRTILQVLVQARSPGAIKQQVCNGLVTLERFDGVWIGEPDLEREELNVAARAGTLGQYLETVPLALTDESRQPAVRAVRNRTPIDEANIASSPQQEEWRNTALLYDFRSVISVPLVHNDILYGVLTVYSTQPERFDERTRTVLTELGELIGYSLNMADRRNALLEGGTDEFTLRLTGNTDALMKLAAGLSIELEIENITSRSEGTYLVHFLADGADPTAIRNIAERMAEFESVRRLPGDDPVRYEAILIGECIATRLADLGAKLRTITVSGTRCRIDVSIPETLDRRACSRHLKEQYPDLEFIARSNGGLPKTRSYRGILNESLTDRQRDILTTAYYSGFFEQPRNRTGSEIASLLEISQPAFSKQLRLAEANLLATILEDD